MSEISASFSSLDSIISGAFCSTGGRGGLLSDFSTLITTVSPDDKTSKGIFSLSSRTTLLLSLYVIGGTVIGLLSIFLFAFICSRRFQFSNESRFLYQLFTLISIETFLFITWPARLRPEIIWTGFFLIGFWLGLGIESAYIRFKKHHNWCKVVISAVVGMIFFIFLRGQLQILIQELNHAKIFIFSIHACLCGIYVTALAPSIFKQLNLAEK